jgi:putative oxidoreductase
MTDVAYALGRILVPIVFIVMGVQQILNAEELATTLIANNIPIPAEIENYLQGLSRYVVLAYVIAGLEVLAGVMVLLGLKARWGALILVIYSVSTIYFVHHFWNMEPAMATTHQYLALLHLSALGGLLLIAAVGSGPGSLDGRPVR